MDKDFRDLLVRYVNGNCTPDEIDKIHRWYRMIGDKELQLDETERRAMEARMRARIVNALTDHHRPLGKRRYLLHPLIKVAAAVVILGLCFLGIFGGNDRSEDHIVEVTASSGEVIVENQTTEVKMYILPDGSTVQLGVLGKIRFSRDFSVGNREVYLTGMAFFDIVKDPSRPFYVYSGKVATKVLGTSFTVDAPADASRVEVKVKTGKVSVFQIAEDESKRKDPSAGKNSINNGVVLSPNQKVEYFIEGGHWVTGLVENPVPVKPIEKETLSFVFDNTPVRDVLADVKERYGIEVVTENERICECTFTGDVSRMALYDMLDVIANAIGSTYEVKGTRILISGKGCD